MIAHGARCPQRQSGIVMFIALIALVVLTVGGVALMRTMAPAATIAGNMAFKQAATQASDIGVELAFKYMEKTIIPAGPHNDRAGRYYATMRNTNLNGLPQINSPTVPINWDDDNRLPCFDTDAKLLANCGDESTYRVQYVIDRQCEAMAGNQSPETDLEISQYCLLAPPGNSRNSKVSSASHFAEPRPVIYRVTINVRGPRNTSSLIQASFTF